MAHQKLTQSLVNETPLSAGGQTFIRDSELRGFALRVGKTGKTYIVEGRTNGRVRRVKIGDVSLFTITEARKRAKLELANMADGIDTNAAKAAAKAQVITLGEALASFVETRPLKPATRQHYEAAVPRYFPKWMKTPLKLITPNDFVAQFDRILSKHGEASAALATRTFGAIWNHTRAATADAEGYPILPETPSNRVKALKKMPKVPRRQGHIRDMAAFFEAVAQVPSEDFRDLIELAVRSGARRSELANLKWEHVDFKHSVYTFPDTKNGLPHTLPMSDQVREILMRLNGRHGAGAYIWGERPLLDPRKSLAAFQKALGEPLTLHDCRRSFINLADECDVPNQKIKALVNHITGDVTDGYRTNRDPERLRVAMQAISDLIDQKRVAS